MLSGLGLNEVERQRIELLLAAEAIQVSIKKKRLK